MSTVSTVSTAPRTVPPQRMAPAAERGRTVIPEKVVAKIVARAAEEVDDTWGTQRRLGSLRGGGSRSARADVRVTGGSVTVRLSIAVRYPRPVRQTARRVREHVRERVGELTGLTVKHVDIDVAELVRDRRTE